MNRAEECQKWRLESAVGHNSQPVILQELHVPHIGPRDFDGRVEDLLQ